MVLDAVDLNDAIVAHSIAHLLRCCAAVLHGLERCGLVYLALPTQAKNQQKYVHFGSLLRIGVDFSTRLLRVAFTRTASVCAWLTVTHYVAVVSIRLQRSQVLLTQHYWVRIVKVKLDV